MPKLLNHKEYCKDLKEITTSKIFDKRKFHPEGLFSEQIFGPLKNYTCQCGKYFGVSRSGIQCSDCKVDIVNSTERRRRFAKISLPIKVVNPLYYDLVSEVLPSDVKKRIDCLMNNDKSFLYKYTVKCKKGDEEIDEIYYDVAMEEDKEKLPKGYEIVGEELEAVKICVQVAAESLLKIEERKNDKEKNLEKIHSLNIILKNIDEVLLDEIIVLPPDLRPASKGLSKNSHAVDKINRYYMQILTKVETMLGTKTVKTQIVNGETVTKEEYSGGTIIDIRKNKEMFYSYYRHLQRDVNELYSNVLEKLSKKEGLIRGNILGKRIDFSGRSVIVPDPTLNLDECVLPYLMILELFKIQIAKKLLEYGKYRLLNDAIDYVDDCIETKNISLFNICKEIVKNEVCLLNRQPSLHRLSMLGFKIKLEKEEEKNSILGNVIKIHPLVCPPYNADFDGDQMAVYIPIDSNGLESKKEVMDKLIVTKNLTNPANGSLTTTPSQDIILGIYMLSINAFPKLKGEEGCKGKTITKSMKLINDCFPEDFPLIDKPIGKKALIRMLNDVKNSYSEKVVANVLDNIKLLGFKYSTLYGSTMSLDEFKLKNSNEFRDNLYKSENVNEQLNKVSGKETEKILKDNFTYSYMIESGARGSWDQVRQIILTRGFISNFKGEILTTPIKHSLIDGLTQQEFFNSTYGCRKGLLDVALNTGTSGYLSRKLIFACANLQISKDIEDCGTTDYLQVFVKYLHKAEMLVHRYYFDGSKLKKITKKNCKGLVGKVIKVRSPIYCKSERICHKCYGDLHKYIDSRFIGIIAAQSLGETNTQLVLRTFHTSGVAVTKENEQGTENKEMKQMDIVSDLSFASKALHHVKKKSCEELVDELFDIYNSSRTIYHVHFESVVAQLMWHGSVKWRLLDTYGVNRKDIEPEYFSVQTVPSKESWLMGLAFSNPRKHILSGIIECGEYKGIIDKILCGEKIKKE